MRRFHISLLLLTSFGCGERQQPAADATVTAIPEKPSPPAPPTQTGKLFEFHPVEVRQDGAMHRFTAQVTNNTGLEYRMARFRMTLYDSHQEGLDILVDELKYFRPGETKDFSAPSFHKGIPPGGKAVIELESWRLR